jgi:hypothetical protein
LRWKVVLLFALVLGLVVPASGERIYSEGVRSVIADCLLEAARIGVVDLETVRDWYPVLVS